MIVIRLGSIMLVIQLLRRDPVATIYVTRDRIHTATATVVTTITIVTVTTANLTPARQQAPPAVTFPSPTH